jgi:hypothetical protein
MAAHRMIQLAQAVEQEGQARAGRGRQSVIEHEERRQRSRPGRPDEGGVVAQPEIASKPEDDRPGGRRHHGGIYSSNRSAWMKASWGTSTRPMFFMRFLPSF